jgi:hypothetical protein
MRWRVAVIAALGLASLVLILIFATRAVNLEESANGLSNGISQPPPIDQQATAQRQWAEAGALYTAVAPLGTVAVVCAGGILILLSERWRLREAEAQAGTRTISEAGST